MALTERVHHVFLAVTGDLCSANTRMKQAIACMLAEHNAASLMRGGGVILLLDVGCAAHVLHGI
eukprot:4385360-Pyramimonas_sp.AAC.1